MTKLPISVGGQCLLVLLHARGWREERWRRGHHLDAHVAGGAGVTEHAVAAAVLVVATRVDHDGLVVAVGKEGVDDGRAADVALLDSVVADVVVLFAGVGHAVALVDPGEVGLVAEQPLLEGLGVGHGGQVLVGLVGRALAHLARVAALARVQRLVQRLVFQ